MPKKEPIVNQKTKINNNINDQKIVNEALMQAESNSSNENNNNNNSVICNNNDNNQHNGPFIKHSLHGVLNRDDKGCEILFYSIECIKFILFVLIILQSLSVAVERIIGSDVSVDIDNCFNATQTNFFVYDTCTVNVQPHFRIIDWIVLILGALFNAVVVSTTTIELFRYFDAYKECLKTTKHEYNGWKRHFYIFYLFNIAMWIICSTVIIVSYSLLQDILVSISVSLTIVKMDEIVCLMLKIPIDDKATVDSPSFNSIRFQKKKELERHYYIYTILISVVALFTPIAICSIMQFVHIPGINIVSKYF